MSEKYASWVTLRPQWDCCRRGEAKVCILDFKTTWSEFHKANQIATEKGNAERISTQNLSLFTSPESVPNSCVRGYFLVCTKIYFQKGIVVDTKSYCLAPCSQRSDITNHVLFICKGCMSKRDRFSVSDSLEQDSQGVAIF